MDWSVKKRLPLAEQHCKNCKALPEGSPLCPVHNCMLIGWCLEWR
jgi:hypothetical protein